MTLLIGPHCKHYSVLVADTRTSWSHLLGKTHIDRTHKIVQCSMGLVTGSGYLNALNSVKNALMKTDICNTDELMKIIEDYGISEIESLHKNYPKVKDNTCFLVTYRTKVDNKDVLRLSVLHSDYNFQMMFCENAVIVVPIDVDENDSTNHTEALQKELIPFDPKELNDKEYTEQLFLSFFKNTKTISDHFYEISAKSSYVSQDFDIAVLLRNGSIFYGYQGSKENEFKLNIMSGYNQPRVLTPGIFDEGNTIYI